MPIPATHKAFAPIGWDIATLLTVFIIGVLTIIYLPGTNI